jgi:hypothetical protein
LKSWLEMHEALTIVEFVELDFAFVFFSIYFFLFSFVIIMYINFFKQ